MNNYSSSPPSDDRDEYPKVTQADMDRATFRVGLKPASRKQRVTILLDYWPHRILQSQSG
jgi:hypothetical protein